MFIRLTTRLIAIAVLALIENQAPAQSSGLTWPSPATGRELNLEVLRPKNFTTNRPEPLILYLENLAAPRVGTDDDQTIIGDFLADGFLVATLDYAHNSKARVPQLNCDLAELRENLLHKKLMAEFKIDFAHIYIVPAGSRLLRDVVYYREPDRALAMDIIYPAHPAKPVGSVLEFSCDNLNRLGDSSLVICCDTILDAEATEGLAVAMADHPVKAPYKGLDAMPDCAWKIKAAARTLRVEVSKLGGSGKIAAVGFSRGSGMALMLVTTQGLPEFEGRGENTNASSEVSGAVVMSGRFTYLDLLPADHMLPKYAATWGERTNHLEVWRRAGALDYLRRATLPLFLTINCTETADALHQMEVLRQRLAALGSPATFLMDHQPRGHKVTLVPEILQAMDDYLKNCLN